MEGTKRGVGVRARCGLPVLDRVVGGLLGVGVPGDARFPLRWGDAPVYGGGRDVATERDGGEDCEVTTTDKRGRR